MGGPNVGVAAVLAVIVSVSNADLERAISIGRRSDAERARFHAAYIVSLNDATVEQIEVLTEFRRAVMVIEERKQFGDNMFGVRQIEAAVRPFHNQVTVHARLRFHPQNVLTSIPRYELRVGEPDDRLLALGPTVRAPIYADSGTDPHASRAMIGATLDLSFDSGIVGQARRPVSVLLDGKTIASTPVDFGRLD